MVVHLYILYMAVHLKLWYTFAIVEKFIFYQLYYKGVKDHGGKEGSNRSSDPGP